MANAFNEFIIRVYAIDIRRGVEGSKYGQLRVINPAPVMGPIMATSMMGAVFYLAKKYRTGFCWISSICMDV